MFQRLSAVGRNGLGHAPLQSWDLYYQTEGFEYENLYEKTEGQEKKSVGMASCCAIFNLYADFYRISYFQKCLLEPDKIQAGHEGSGVDRASKLY